MSEIVSEDKNKDFIYDLMRSTNIDDFNYLYRGEFTQDLSSLILTLAEKNIDKFGMSSKTKKRIFHIMVESIQNITRHSDKTIDDINIASFFIIQKKNTNYFITSGNLIEKSKVEDLRGKIEEVNSYKQEELTEFYRTILSNGKISSKGGAGLGLIEMARKSGNKLNYDFRDINDELSYFYLNTNVSAEDESSTAQTTQEGFALDYLINLHSFVNQENIILIYSTIFDQSGLLGLFSILDTQMKEQGYFKKKVIAIMVEMLQNIIHHGEEHEDKMGNYGIFYISESADDFYLNTGNFVRNDKIGIFSSKLEHVNSLHGDALEKFYSERLFDFEHNTPKEAGLGIIEMRLKSDELLKYNFQKINNDYSFFTLRVTIKKVA